MSSLHGVASLLALALAPGVVAMVLWSPILLSERLRALFRQVPPTTSVLVSYVLVALVLSLPFLGSALFALSQSAANGAALSNAILDAVVKLAIVYILGLPVIAGVGLPRIGIDWDPTRYRASTWVLLVVSMVWYVAVFAIPLVLLSIVFALPT